MEKKEVNVADEMNGSQSAEACVVRKAHTLKRMKLSNWSFENCS